MMTKRRDPRSKASDTSPLRIQHFPDPIQPFLLELPDPLPREPEFLAEGREGPAFPVDPEPAEDDEPESPGEGGQGLVEEVLDLVVLLPLGGDRARLRGPRARLVEPQVENGVKGSEGEPGTLTFASPEEGQDHRSGGVGRPRGRSTAFGVEGTAVAEDVEEDLLGEVLDVEPVDACGAVSESVDPGEDLFDQFRRGEGFGGGQLNAGHAGGISESRGQRAARELVESHHASTSATQRGSSVWRWGVIRCPSPRCPRSCSR